MDYLLEGIKIENIGCVLNYLKNEYISQYLLIICCVFYWVFYYFEGKLVFRENFVDIFYGLQIVNRYIQMSRLVEIEGGLIIFWVKRVKI